VAGYDLSVHEPKLYWIDYLGTMAPVPFGAHGYGSYFALSLLDRFVSSVRETRSRRLHDHRRYHDPEATVEEGLATLRRCIDEVSKRLVVTPGKFKVKIVDKDGVREVEF